LAEKKKCTPVQVVLAWLLKQSELIIPIPGSTRAEGVEECFGCLKIDLSDEDVKEIRGFVNKADIRGLRYSSQFLFYWLASVLFLHVSEKIPIQYFSSRKTSFQKLNQLTAFFLSLNKNNTKRDAPGHIEWLIPPPRRQTPPEIFPENQTSGKNMTKNKAAIINGF
jgi:hypothetical protein